MRIAQCALGAFTAIVIVLSGVCLAKDGVLQMDPVGNAVMVLFWLAIPATWFIVGLRTRSESTIGFCLLFAVYYSFCLLYFLALEEDRDEMSGGQIFTPVLLLMGAPFLVVFESYSRKLVVWFYAKCSERGSVRSQSNR